MLYFQAWITLTKEAVKHMHTQITTEPRGAVTCGYLFSVL